MASNILVMGSVNGRFAEAFGKVAALNPKHNFALAIVAGNLFAAAETATDHDQEQVAKLINGDIHVPVPTYFALGTRPLPPAVVEKLTTNGGDVCPNLTILGRKVSIKTASGVKIVAVGGKHAARADETTLDEYAPVYTEAHVESAKHFADADILLTSDWPAGILHGSQAEFCGQMPPAFDCLGELVTALKPRYHFSTSNAFYERDPFFHNVDAPRPITRFLSLAPFGNPAKAKHFYAFQLDPSAPPPDQPPEGCTATPFATTKRKRDSQQQSHNTFRFSHGDGYRQHDGARRVKRARGGGRGHASQPRECYFCLSNQTAKTHMVAHIGDDAYMTVAKGPLTTPETFPGLGMPCHMLIISMQHAPTIQAIDDDHRDATQREMQRYRTALHNMISAKSTRGEDGEAQLGSVTWEISRGGGVHIHWQFLPVPVHMIQKGLVEAAFDVEAENRGYPQFLKTPDAVEAAQDGHYFKAMLWSEAIQKDILLPLDGAFPFDLQFARRVLGKLLGLENRWQWKDVEQSPHEEEKDAQTFMKAFEPFEYTDA